LIGEKVLESDLMVNMGNEIVKTARLTGDEPTRVEGLDLLWLPIGQEVTVRMMFVYNRRY